MVAPFIFASEEWLAHKIDPYEPRFLSAQQLKSQKYPLYVVCLAVLLQLSSVLLIWFLSKRHIPHTSQRLTWLGLAAVLGLPALLSYLLLQPLRRH